MSKTFNHNRKVFEIRHAKNSNGITVQVFLEGIAVGITYSASFDVAYDYFCQHKEAVLNHLMELAESDIRNNLYREQSKENDFGIEF